MKYFLVLILTPLLILLLGFHKNCKNTIQDRVLIQNLTGLPLTLFICKENYGESLLSLSPSTTGMVNLGIREESTPTPSDQFGRCKANNKINNNLNLFLSPTSYGLVLLCHRPSDNSYAIATIQQGCPKSYIPQTSTAPCQTTN